MVTHPTTTQPVECLSTPERTGWPVLTRLWSYVLERTSNAFMKYQRMCVTGASRDVTVMTPLLYEVTSERRTLPVALEIRKIERLTNTCLLLNEEPGENREQEISTSGCAIVQQSHYQHYAYVQADSLPLSSLSSHLSLIHI